MWANIGATFYRLARHWTDAPLLQQCQTSLSSAVCHGRCDAPNAGVTLGECWPNVCDVDPTLNECFSVLVCVLNVVTGHFTSKELRPFGCKRQNTCPGNMRLNRCCFNVGPPSQTVGQHWNNIGSTSLVLVGCEVTVTVSQWPLQAVTLSHHSQVGDTFSRGTQYFRGYSVLTVWG